MYNWEELLIIYNELCDRCINDFSIIFVPFGGIDAAEDRFRFGR